MRKGPRRRPIFYGWFLLALCLGNITVTNGVANVFSVIFVALLAEFELNRATFAGIFSLYMFVVFCGGVLVGPLLDRFGPRKVIPLGSILIALGLAACSRISSPYQLYVFFGIIASIGACSTSWIPNTTIIAKWFVRKRGMAVGIVMCGSGMAVLVFVPLTQLLIEWSGWRGAFLWIAAIAVLWLAPLNALFQRARPEEIGLLADGDAPEAAEAQKKNVGFTQDGPRTWTLSEALRQRSFWMMCLAVFCNPLVTFTMMLHQVALIVERGFPPLYVSSMLGLVGVFAMLGRVVCGSLSDRIGREQAYTIFMTPAALAIVCLFFLSQDRSWILWFYVVLWGLGMGVGGALFPPMIADLFFGPSLGRIMGITAAFGGFGAAFGSWFAGYTHDLTGGYRLALSCLLLAVCGAVASVWAAAPRRVKEKRY
jgi:MFS family permease